MFERREVMLTRWYDIDREAVALDELHRRMDRLFGELWGGHPRRTGPTALAGSWPPANLYDTGSSLTAVVQVPGLAEGDIKVEVQGDVMSVTGERKAEVPEGSRVHRSERGSRRFTRSFGLPCRVDSEKTTASLRDGLLTVTMDKHAEAQPKQITVSAG
jgi:HSP20 family protein